MTEGSEVVEVAELNPVPCVICGELFVPENEDEKAEKICSPECYTEDYGPSVSSRKKPRLDDWR